jgi:ubiquinone/menaquinone biosynthesis C-methylase UbiE
MGFWANHVVPRLIEKACRSRTILAERRRWIPRAHGDVLELGVGSGLNLPFYDASRVAKVTGVDISRPLLRRAVPRARQASVPVELVEASAEALPFDAASFDSVVVTYSLCSMEDPARAAAEARRVLRSGGDLMFVEHGRAPDRGTRWWQRLLNPLWRRISGGCRLDRDMPAVLRAAGFELDELTAGYSGTVRWLSFTFEGSAHPHGRELAAGAEP